MGTASPPPTAPARVADRRGLSPSTDVTAPDLAWPDVTGPDVAWLAACAMGLACSPARGGRRVEMLGRAAQWDVALLEAAHRTVSDADVADRATREGAANLLRAALARSRRDPAVSPRRAATAAGGWSARR